MFAPMKSPLPSLVPLTLAIGLTLLSPAFGADDPVKNGDFSAGLANWSAAGRAKAKGQVSVVEETPGNKALQIQLDGSEKIVVEQDMRVPKAFEKLTVTIRAKASADFQSEGEHANSVVVRVDAANLGNRWQYTWRSHVVKPGGEWVTFTSDLSAATNGRAIKLELSVEKGKGTLWIDDVVVTQRQ